MPYTPLTKDQYQKAVSAGFTPQQIIENEKRRKLDIQAKESQQPQNNVLPAKKEGPTGLKGFFSGLYKSGAQVVQNTESLSQKGLDFITKPIVEKVTGKPYQATPTLAETLGDKLEAKTTSEKVGKFTGDVAQFFIPAGAAGKAEKATETALGASKLAKVLGLGAKATTEGLTSAGLVGLQGGNKKDVKVAGALGAIMPVAGKIASETITKGIPKLSSLATGVRQQIYKLAYDDPKWMQAALDTVHENPAKPYLRLAENIGGKLKDFFQNVETKYVNNVKQIAEATQAQNKMYNAQPFISELERPLAQHNLGLTSAGKLVIKKTTPFTERELGNVQELIDTVNESKNIPLKDLIDLKQKFSRFYDLVPYSNEGTPTKYHALVKGLEDTVDELIGKQEPALAETNAVYAKGRQVWSQFKSKFLDANGNIREGAEQYLANLGNINKGARQKAIQELEQATGLPILKSVDYLKAAQKLKNVFPETGSRTLDILRSLGIKGLAAGSGAAALLNPGAALAGATGVAASSPLVAGKAAMTLGKLAKKPLIQGIQRLLPIASQALKGTIIKSTDQ